MSIAEWIGIITIGLAYASAIIGFWLSIKIKVAELELKIKELEKRHDAHVKWGEAEQRENVSNFSKIQIEMRSSYKELADKMDIMISKFNDFQVYCEKNFKK